MHNYIYKYNHCHESGPLVTAVLTGIYSQCISTPATAISRRARTEAPAAPAPDSSERGTEAGR